MEDVGSLVKSAKRRAALQVSLDVLGVTMNLQSSGDEEPALPMTAGLYLLTVCDCPGQTRQTDLEV